MRKLFSVGSNVNEYIRQADFNYAKAVQANPRSPNVLKSYASFLEVTSSISFALTVRRAFAMIPERVLN